MGQWYDTKFEFNDDILNKFPVQLKELELYKDRLDVLKKRTNRSWKQSEKFWWYRVE